jgi:RimJ/RimL family protein N-acetyltransferase
MLPGSLVDLRPAERADLPMLAAWFNDIEVNGAFESFEQSSLTDVERDFEAKPDVRWWIVQAKDGTPVGYVGHGKADGGCWIGYFLVPWERGKGYGGEAVLLVTDYLFLHKDIGRVQAETHPANAASRRVLEKAGFTHEGILRRTHFSRGTWRDTAMYSLLREEWVAPRVLPGPYRPDALG